MTKITKKAYNEAANYMVAIDYLSGLGAVHGKKSWQTWQTEALEAKSLIEAMSEAEDWMNEDVYMIHLCEKTGKTDTAIRYKAVLANRGHGWHGQDNKHYESTDMGFEVGTEPKAYEYAAFDKTTNW